MASRMRAPTLALTGLSMCLAISIIGTAGRSLHVYYSQRDSDPWLLPLWPGHFDSRELETLIGSSATIFFLNGLLAISLLIPSFPANTIVLASSFLSTLVATVAISFSTITNNQSPTRDTLQTWTCSWSALSPSILQGESPPYQFQGLCSKTKFAYYATIPLLVIQAVLFTAGLYAFFARPPQHRHHHQQIEKQAGLPLQDVRAVSYETKTETRRIYQDSNGYYGVAK